MCGTHAYACGGDGLGLAGIRPALAPRDVLGWLAGGLLGGRSDVLTATHTHHAGRLVRSLAACQRSQPASQPARRRATASESAGGGSANLPFLSRHSLTAA